MKVFDSYVILYDGYCNLCAGVVKFTLKRDRINKFKYASLQSDYAYSILQKFDLPSTNFQSFILVSQDSYYSKSTAALMVLKELGGFWRIFYVFIFVPKVIRDAVYSFIANNRYRLFGKRTTCLLPSKDYQERFID